MPKIGLHCYHTKFFFMWYACLVALVPRLHIVIIVAARLSLVQQCIRSQCATGVRLEVLLKWGLCQPHVLGRLRKAHVVLDSTLHWLNPKRSAQIDPDVDTPVNAPVVVDDDNNGINYASQAHILKVLKLMGCNDEHEL